jgi:PBP1b-binding outer membrane lipoprotein LpoB
MKKLNIIFLLCFSVFILNGCIVTSVVGTAVSAASTVVGVAVDVTKAGVKTVTGAGD